MSCRLPHLLIRLGTRLELAPGLTNDCADREYTYVASLKFITAKIAGASPFNTEHQSDAGRGPEQDVAFGYRRENTGLVLKSTTRLVLHEVVWKPFLLVLMERKRRGLTAISDLVPST